METLLNCPIIQVQVTVDYVQAARTEPGQGSFPEKYCCTVMIGGVNVAEALIRYIFTPVVQRWILI